MFVLTGLVTAPEAQGLGHTGALLEVLLATADAEGRAVRTSTTDAAGSYARHGFELLGEAWVATNDPDYNRPPAPVRAISGSLSHLKVGL
ncbi:uncharacterized protein BXZ73DRAFT_100292 [Epithele typhae]|uniref:uncharacterized protein n=1 Tax=Epithele typhae TaxID=378194 RepID=UPI00200833C9|nr:uncharacterized protein BXZ73DRAFT_100292 [Epithele typhae]KAH9936877.1 hypothetical protein BXZ73DRAFT_100292 [Epithele typhae]